MKLTMLAILFLLLPAFTADAAHAFHHRKHASGPKSHASEPAAAPTPPVTRLPVAPDTFRA